ncbi:MAG: OmpA family protein [Anaeromyxobacter sp.]|nr:OmpA family protein [Anaeromyxobacter sp.]MBL0276282.1 OmpA family protein [Anaeromyxobacter sp.]
MRRVLLLALTATVTLLTACPSPPKNGECKSSADCASQAGFGKVCVSGQCSECAADADCKDGFACRANRCEPKAATSSEAALPTKTPASECTGAADCGAGRDCQAGRCVTAAIDPACADAAAFTVGFGFDQAELSGGAPETLKRLAACLKGGVSRVSVEGHCDDRGTTVYNLALGKKRAEAVKRYLGDLGVTTPVDTNTYGEEKPVCREASEACWARNRRAEVQLGR